MPRSRPPKYESTANLGLSVTFSKAKPKAALTTEQTQAQKAKNTRLALIRRVAMKGL